ncbi:MAG: hypothetical protein P9L97_07975 [Candidatus Tenebribacter davisii]|jgi:hypothetical protein|nr:hypothetical protein [Candidatus Tenebribacter davisii]
MKRLIFPLLLLVLIFTGCTIRYVPVQSDGVTITDNFGVKKAKDFTFAAANEYWNKEPQKLTNYFTTFYISIQNRERKEMEVTMSDFGLIDQNGNQFDVITQDYIENLLAPRQIDYLLLNENKEEPINTEDFFNEQKLIMEKWRTARNNLLTYSFHFGKIMPGAKKSGFLFFPKLESENAECILKFNDMSINFIRLDEKKKLDK